MRVYVCMCVCMYVCVYRNYVCVFVCEVYVCACIYVSEGARVCFRIYVLVNMRVHACVCLHYRLYWNGHIVFEHQLLGLYL